MRAFPSDSIPEGWYQVGWSSEFDIGSVKPLEYFDQELVCFRSETGQMVVLDAYCRHMGAHLGFGGVVEGTGIRCPFHGWKFDADGVNVDIPYSRPDQMRNLRLGCWQTREVDGLVLVWFSALDRPPVWEPTAWIPSDVEFWDTCPRSTKIWSDCTVAPQFVVENAADAAHFRYVHTAHDVPDFEDFSVRGEVFEVDLAYKFGAGSEQTWATPHGPVAGSLFTRCQGLGFIFSRLAGFDTIYNILSVTPKTSRMADIRSTNFIPRLRGDGSELSDDIRGKWVRQQHNQVGADIPVWSNLSFVERPPFAQSEAKAFRAFKKWARQFYPENIIEQVPSEVDRQSVS